MHCYSSAPLGFADWGLNLGPHTCYIIVLTLSYTSSPAVSFLNAYVASYIILSSFVSIKSILCFYAQVVWNWLLQDKVSCLLQDCRVILEGDVT